MYDKPLVFIAAGSPDTIYGTLKHNLIIDGKSILERTIDETLSEGFNVITAVNKREYISGRYAEDKRVMVLDSKDMMIRSCIYGLVEGVIKYLKMPEYSGKLNSFHSIKEYIKKNPEVRDIVVIYKGSDSPFGNTHLDDTLKEYEKMPSDIYVCVADVDKAIKMNNELDLKIDKKRTSLFNHCITEKGKSRTNNTYIIKPFVILEKGLVGVFQALYDLRNFSKDIKLTSIPVIFGGAYEMSHILKEDIHKSKKLVRDIMHLRAHTKGKRHEEVINSEEVISNASELVGITIRVGFNGRIAPFLDIDDSHTYNIFKKQFERIEDYIKKNNI